MSGGLEQWAREIAYKAIGGFCSDERVATLQQDILYFVTTIQAETREADAQAVNGLIGRDSGNWNRAIVYAVDTIRAQGRRDGREG